MPRSLLVALLFGISFCTTSACIALGQEVVEGEVVVVQVITTDLVEAQYAYELAKLELQQYRHVTLPQHRRHLDEQIRNS